MKKSFLLITITILLFITGSNSAQSIIHPGRVGFGYAYGYSDVNGMNLYGNSFYISSGHIDFVLNFYDLETGTKDIPYTSGSISYTSIKPNRRIYPSFHLGYGGGNNAVLSFGISVAGEIFHDTDFKILPEGGVEFAYAKGGGGNSNETETFNLAGNAGFYANVNVAFGGETVPFYITLSPGIEVSSKATSYSIALAASIVP
jgi:hypothetical protein